MKITLINPKVTQGLGSRSLQVPQKIKDLLKNNPKLHDKMKFSLNTMGALGALSIAGCVPDDIEVEFFDENMEELDLERNFDLVAISGNSGQMNRALGICDKLRKRKIPVVAGGPAVVTFPDQYLRKKVHVVLGEGEALFAKFIQDFAMGKPREIYDNKVAENHVDLEGVPIPRYDLAAKYPYSMVGVQVSRGCPYNCSFCQVKKIYGSKYRHKPVEKIIEELELVKKYWPKSFFLFYDDNPFFNRDFALRLFSKINERNIDLGRWGANANVTLYKDKELLELLTVQGPVSFLGLGLESLSVESLKTLDNKMKINNVERYQEAIATFKRHKINPVAYFMFGFENSKKEDLDAIVKFCLDNEIDGALTRVTPMPGTTLYDYLKAEYEEKYGKIRKSSLGEWGVVRDYLSEKTGIAEEHMQEYLADAFSVLFSDENFGHSDGPIPFYFLF